MILKISSIPFLFLITGTMIAATPTIQVVGATQTQIVLRACYTPGEPLAIRVKDNNGGPDVSDVNGTKFPSSDTDLGRTSANGFRWPTIVDPDGACRQIVIGGHNEVKVGADGNNYSTALQVATAHTITLTPVSHGDESATIVVSTANLSTGSSYPESIISMPKRGVAGWLTPTFDNANIRTTMVTDPSTGVLIRGIGNSADRISGFGCCGYTFGFAYDSTGTAWANPNNINTDKQAGTLAVTSTPNSPLFVSGNSGFFGNNGDSDLQLQLYGCGGGCNRKGSSVTVGMYITVDSGQTRASDEVTQVFDDLAPHVQGQSIPQPYPSGNYSAWGLKPLYPAALVNVSCNGVSITGTTVTSGGNGCFNINRSPGTVFTLSSCKTGTPNPFPATAPATIAIVDNPTTLRANQSAEASGCTFTEYAAGIAIELKTVGTLSISLSPDTSPWGALGSGGGPNMESNGDNYMCAPSKVTDISIGVDGTQYNPPMSGWLCYTPIYGNGMQPVYLFQDDGKIGLQSWSSSSTGSNQRCNIADSPFIANNAWIVTGTANQHVYKITKQPGGDYREYVPGTNLTAVDKYDYYDITARAPSLTAQVQNAGGECAKALNSGLFGSISLQVPTTAGLWYYFGAGSSGDQLPVDLFTDFSGTLIGCKASWDTTAYPERFGYRHLTPSSLNQYSLVFNGVTCGNGNCSSYNSSNALHGPFILQPTGWSKDGVSWSSGISFAIDSATNTSPVQLHVPTTTDLSKSHAITNDFKTSPWMTCSGFTGSWALLNGTFRASRIDENNFTLYDTSGNPIDSTSWSSYSGSGTCSTTPPLYLGIVGAIKTNPSDNNAAQISVNDKSPEITNYFASSLHISDGDGIVFKNYPTRQYYAKVSCSGCSQTAVDIYTDKTLHNPESASNIPLAANQLFNNAYTCPTSTQVPAPGILFDPDGAVGTAQTPNVRCFYLEVKGEPCSYWAGDAESTKYPCSTNAQTYTSELSTLQPGDSLQDILLNSNAPYGSGPDWSGETFLVLAKDVTSHPGYARLTLMRWSQEGQTQSARNQFYHMFEHPPGWFPFVVPTAGMVLIDSSQTSLPLTPLDTTWTGVHMDAGLMPSGNAITAVFGWQAHSQDSYYNLPLARAALTPLHTFDHSNALVWNDSSATSWNCQGGVCGQSYPSARHLRTASGNELFWTADYASANGSNGSYCQGSGASITLSPVAATNFVYTITNPAGTLAIKTQPYVAFAPYYGLYQDISSAATGDIITDSTLNSFCIANANGECRHDSTVGTIYIAAKGLRQFNGGPDYYTSCPYPQPLFYAMPPWAGWMIQVQQLPKDHDGSGTRRLTQGFIPGTWAPTFANWRPAFPDPISGGTYGFAVISGEWRLIKTPPYNGTRHGGRDGQGESTVSPLLPAGDSARVRRSTYIEHATRIDSGVATQGRYLFGYYENDNMLSGTPYCVSRQEVCFTSTQASINAPFSFGSEIPHAASCSSGCTINVPLIPGRVAVLQFEADGALGGKLYIPIP